MSNLQNTRRKLVLIEAAKASLALIDPDPACEEWVRYMAVVSALEALETEYSGELAWREMSFGALPQGAILREVSDG